jgi:hypothetical protein
MKIVSVAKTSAGGRKPGLVDSKLDSRSKGRGFESYTRWKWCQSHARLIKVYPILVHSIIEKKRNLKIQVAKWGTPKKKI